MATTIDLTEQELEDIKEVTDQQDVAVAIRTAMREYVRYVRRMKLLELSNKIEMMDNWQELEKLECSMNHDNGRSGAH